MFLYVKQYVAVVNNGGLIELQMYVDVDCHTLLFCALVAPVFISVMLEAAVKLINAC